MTGVCSSEHVGRPRSLDGANLHLDEIADLEQVGRRRLACPRERGLRQLDFVCADADARAPSPTNVTTAGTMSPARIG